MVIGIAAKEIGYTKISISFTEVNKYNLKKVYFIVHPKVDQRAGILSLLHLGIFAIHTRYFFKV